MESPSTCRSDIIINDINLPILDATKNSEKEKVSIWSIYLKL
jgi:hypothetical protein